jgi:hypothetical protein
MMRLAAAILAGGTAAMLLAACGADPAEKASAQDPAHGEYTIDKQTGETRMTIKVPEGTASLRSGAKVPLRLPAGFTLFPGATVVTNTVVSQPDGQGTMVSFETDAAADDVIAHYKAEAIAAGFAIELEVNTNGSHLIGGVRKRDGSHLSVTATQGKPTTAQLIIGNKQGG